MAAAANNNTNNANNTICVLYADDELINRKIFTKFAKSRFSDYIDKYGVIIECLKDGNEVIPFITRNENYHFIIVLDEEMKDMSGSQTAQKIRDMGYRYFIFGHSANIECHNANLLNSSDIEEFDALSQLTLLPPDNMPGLISQSTTPQSSRSPSISSINSLSPEIRPRKSFFGNLLSRIRRSSQVQSLEISPAASVSSACSSAVSSPDSSKAPTRRNSAEILSVKMPLFNFCYLKPEKREDLFNRIEEILKIRFSSSEDI